MPLWGHDWADAVRTPPAALHAKRPLRLGLSPSPRRHPLSPSSPLLSPLGGDAWWRGLPASPDPRHPCHPSLPLRSLRRPIAATGAVRSSVRASPEVQWTHKGVTGVTGAPAAARDGRTDRHPSGHGWGRISGLGEAQKVEFPNISASEARCRRYIG